MKRFRIMKIKEIIQNHIIETQEELAAALRKEGVDVTQATVSRDIKELQLLKIPYGSEGRYKYALSSEKKVMLPDNHVSVLFQQAITKIDSSMNLIVIHTIPGSAQSVAFSIDHSDHKEIIGTLAGDDTVLVIMKSVEDVPVFVDRIQQYLKV